MILSSTSDKISLTTSGSADIDVQASWADLSATAFTPGRTNSAIASATTTDIVGSPGASTQRSVKSINVRNKHATDPNTVTITHDDGSTPVVMFEVELPAGYTLIYDDDNGFRVTDVLGQVLTVSTVVGQVPVGGIIMWSGTIATIPDDWALCDGTANSPGPDLRDTFVVGATEDDAGAAKSNIEGSLNASGGATGHSHSGHANLTHAGGSVADHTGLTHGLTINDHPDLTHAALSVLGQTITHADHSIASVTHTHAASTLTHADHSVASFTGSQSPITLTHPDHSVPTATGSQAATTLTHPDIAIASISGTHASQTFTVPSQTHTHASSAVGQASLVLSISSQGTARTIMTGSSVTVPTFTGTNASMTGTVASGTHSHAATTLTQADHVIASVSHTHAGQTLTHADHSVPSASHTHAAVTLTHPDHSLASHSGSHPATTLTHPDHSVPSYTRDLGTHKGTDYGVHVFTAPAAHGTAGTLTHSFHEPDDHTISAHDTVSNVVPYYALAFIQRMS